MGADLDNIDRFNMLVGFVFEELYRAFPIPIEHIQPHVILKKMGVEIELYNYGEGDSAPFPMTFGPFPETDISSIRFLYSALAWLQSEGFINAQGDDSNYQVVLTAKALAALNATPDSLNKKSLGKQLGDAAKGAGGEVANKAIGEIVGQVLGGIAKGIFT